MFLCCKLFCLCRFWTTSSIILKYSKS